MLVEDMLVVWELVISYDSRIKMVARLTLFLQSFFPSNNMQKGLRARDNGHVSWICESEFYARLASVAERLY